MTNPDLAALSAAATQGEWQVAAWYRNSGTPDELCGGFIEADDTPTGVIDENWMQDSESLSRDLDFIVALVNAYRTGNLVQIDRDGLRAKLSRLFKRYHRDTCYPQASDAEVGFFADAAIAAILGGKHDRHV